MAVQQHVEYRVNNICIEGLNTSTLISKYVIKSFVITSSDSHHVTVANLLREIIMVRDHFLMLPRWFTRDDIDDVIFTICVS